VGAASATTPLRPSGRRYDGRWLLLPFFALYLLFYLIPVLHGLVMSVHGHTKLDLGPFVGVDNYRFVLEDPAFRKAARNAFYYLGAVLLLTVPLAIVLAHLLAATWRPLRPVFCFGLLAPGLTPPAVLAILFLLVFYGRYGMLNRGVLMPLGMDKPINWLKDPDWIMPALIIQCAWRWVGILSFFMLAALQAVPKDQQEAARLAGAGPFAMAWHVSLPFIRPVVLFCALYLAIDALSLFAGAYYLLGGSGGTADAGLLPVAYVYQKSWLGQLGVAAAAAFTIAPTLLALLGILIWRFGGRRQ
jgi:ABC-type sugar transport system permease subunit